MSSRSTFCALKMDRAEARTSVISGTLDPIWGESFYFQLNRTAQLELTVLEPPSATSSLLELGETVRTKVNKSVWSDSSQDLAAKSREATNNLGCVSLSMAQIIEALEEVNAQGDHDLHTWCPIEPFTVQRSWLKKGASVQHILQGSGRIFVNFSFVPWSKVAEERCEITKLRRTVIPQPLPLASWARAKAGSGANEGQDGEEVSRDFTDNDPYSRAAGELWRSRRAEDVARAKTWQQGRQDKQDAVGAHSMEAQRSFTPFFYPSEEPYRILCLDGGGVRGVLEAALLERLYVAFPTLIEELDLIAGTSTGGMLAGLLAAGYSPRHCKSIYAHHAREVFTSWPSRRYSLFNATYDAPSKEQVMRLYLGDIQMGELQKKVLITAFRMHDNKRPSTGSMYGQGLRGASALWANANADKHVPTNAEDSSGWSPVCFTNLPGGADDAAMSAGSTRSPCDSWSPVGWTERDGDRMQLEAVDAGMRTSAAPVYFPVQDGYIDGAVFANNPSVVALAAARSCYPKLRTRNIRLLSIGSGHYPMQLDTREEDLGIRQWAPNLLSLMMEAGQLKDEMTLEMMLGGERGQYHRLDPLLPWRIPLDEVGAIDEIVRLADETDLTETARFLREQFELPAQ
jgi:hypothetical protein